MSLYGKAKTVLWYPFAYLFQFEKVTASPRVVSVSEYITISGTVRNNSRRPATTYIVVAVRSPYAPDVVFNSHEMLDERHRASLKKIHILPGDVAGFAVQWRVPPSTPRRVYHTRVEAWTPAKLDGATWKFPAYRHTATAWDRINIFGTFEVVGSGLLGSHRAFVSYAHEDAEWVELLCEELRRQELGLIFDKYELKPGDDLGEFMFRLTKAEVVLPVCSASYLAKWHSEKPTGVKIETELSAAERRENHRKFIPILRDNTTAELPDYLSAVWAADMRGTDWRGKPLLDLINTLRRILPGA